MIQNEKEGSQRVKNLVTAVDQIGLTPSNPAEGRFAAFKYEVFGDPKSYGNGTEREGTVLADGPEGSVQIKCRARRITSPFPDYTAKFGTDAFWDLYSYEPQSDTSTGNLNLNNQITGDVGISGDNYFAQRVGLGGSTGVIFRVTNVRPTDIIIPAKGVKENLRALPSCLKSRTTASSTRAAPAVRNMS